MDIIVHWKHNRLLKLMDEYSRYVIKVCVGVPVVLLLKMIQITALLLKLLLNRLAKPPQ